MVGIDASCTCRGTLAGDGGRRETSWEAQPRGAAKRGRGTTVGRDACCWHGPWQLAALQECHVRGAHVTLALRHPLNSGVSLPAHPQLGRESLGDSLALVCAKSAPLCLSCQKRRASQ